MNRVRRSTLDFQTGKQPKVLSLFRGGNSIASGDTYRRTILFFGRNNAVTPFGGGEDSLSAILMEIPSAYKPMPFGLAGSKSVLAYSGSPRTTDAKPSIVNSDRTDSRQYCLPRNAGNALLTSFALSASTTRGATDASAARYTKRRAHARHVPNCHRSGVGECASSTST